MHKFLLDCDPGHDDAAAIVYAARHLDLIGITTVHGNVGIDKTTRNALLVCDLIGLDVPVSRGLGEPWVQAPFHAPTVHGESGLGGVDFPDPMREVIDENAVDFIIKQGHRHAGNLVLAATGPLTNVATALRCEPRLRSWLKAITLMGGSTTGGNTTAAAEFNIYADPEAAQAVFDSGVEIRMFGLNVTRQVGVTRDDVERLRRLERPVASVFADLFEFYLGRLNAIFGLDSGSLHDPCVFVPYVDDTLFTFRNVRVDVALAPGLTRGMTVCDLRYSGTGSTQVLAGGGIQEAKPANAWVAVAVEGLKAKAQVLEAIEAA